MHCVGLPARQSCGVPRQMAQAVPACPLIACNMALSATLWLASHCSACACRARPCPAPVSWQRLSAAHRRASLPALQHLRQSLLRQVPACLPLHCPLLQDSCLKKKICQMASLQMHLPASVSMHRRTLGYDMRGEQLDWELTLLHAAEDVPPREDEWDDWQPPVTPEVLSPVSQAPQLAADQASEEPGAMLDPAGEQQAAGQAAAYRGTTLDALAEAAMADTPQQQYLRTVLQDFQTPRGSASGDQPASDQPDGADSAGLGELQTPEGSAAADAARLRQLASAQLAFAGWEAPEAQPSAALAEHATADAPADVPEEVLLKRALDGAQDQLQSTWELYDDLKG